MKRILVTLAVVTGGLSLGVWSCGGGGDSSPTTEDEFCAQRAERECEKLATPCSYAASAVMMCQGTRKTACLLEGVAARQASSNRMFKPANIGTCLSRTSEVFNTVPITAQNWKSLQTACARVWEGSAMMNDACTSDFDCINNLICDKGVCGNQEQVGSGAACNNPGETCPPGQFCATGAQTTFYSCQARAALNSTCGAGMIPCVESLRCIGGMCVDRVEDGNLCGKDEDCKSGLCDPFSLRCGKVVGFSAGGPSCLAFVTSMSFADGGTDASSGN